LKTFRLNLEKQLRRYSKWNFFVEFYQKPNPICYKNVIARLGLNALMNPRYKTAKPITTSDEKPTIFFPSRK